MHAWSAHAHTMQQAARGGVCGHGLVYPRLLGAGIVGVVRYRSRVKGDFWLGVKDEKILTPVAVGSTESIIIYMQPTSP